MDLFAYSNTTTITFTKDKISFTNVLVAVLLKFMFTRNYFFYEYKFCCYNLKYTLSLLLVYGDFKVLIPKENILRPCDSFWVFCLGSKIFMQQLIY